MERFLETWTRLRLSAWDAEIEPEVERRLTAAIECWRARRLAEAEARIADLQRWLTERDRHAVKDTSPSALHGNVLNPQGAGARA